MYPKVDRSLVRRKEKKAGKKIRVVNGKEGSQKLTSPIVHPAPPLRKNGHRGF